MLTSLLKNKKFNISFSGGCDSIYAAHILRKYNPTLYHFNHKLTSEDDGIAERAKQTAQELGLTFVQQDCSTRFVKGSKEDYCRKQRYEWLATIGGTIITAHHLKDATESYIFNCLRGYPEYIPIPISSTFGATTIVRPFIITPKKVINDYVGRNNLTHLIAHDYLNDDPKIMRIWIRNELLPTIKSRTNIEKVVKKKYLKKILDENL